MAIGQEYENDGNANFDAIETRKYRGVAARLNYISPDRIDLQHSTEAARHMSAPVQADMMLLRRIGRYLIGKP